MVKYVYDICMFQELKYTRFNGSGTISNHFQCHMSAIEATPIQRRNLQ